MLEKLIKTLNFEDAKSLEAEMEPGMASAGSVLVAQDDVDADLYLLTTGTYDIYQKVSLAERWAALHIATIEAPAVIGEMNLFRKTQRNASVFVREAGRYLKLDATRLEALKAGQPLLAMRLMEYAGQTVSERFTALQSSLYEKIIAEAESPQQAHIRLEQAIGKLTFCSDALAEKLFGIKQPQL